MNTIKVFYLIFLTSITSINFTECWTVKIVNFTNKTIKVNINSTQSYPGWEKGRPVKRDCSFIGENVEPHATRDFDYKTVNIICAGACTKSVEITSPVSLSASNPLTSCSNVIVVIRQNKFTQKFAITYHDWASAILDILAERTRMPVQVRDIYDEFSDDLIQSLRIFRRIVKGGANQLIKTIAKNETTTLGYDDIFHAGFIIGLSGGKFLKLERVATVSSDASETIEGVREEGFEERDVNLPKGNLTFGKFLENAMENKPDFWKYEPSNNNCQLFVLECLDSNKISLSDDLYNFVFQDAGTILANHPGLKALSIGITQLENRINNLVEGGGRGVIIQNGTPYTIRVIVSFVGASKLFKSCLSKELIVASGSEKRMTQGICLCSKITVGASFKGIDAIQNVVSPEKLKETADVFAESPFVGKLNPRYLVRLTGPKVFQLDPILLTTDDLNQLTAATRANPALNPNLKEAQKQVSVPAPSMQQQKTQTKAPTTTPSPV